MGFRDRFFTPVTAKALMSWRLLVGVAVGLVGGLLGLDPVAAVAVGAGAYGVSVLTAMPKSTHSRIDPFAISEPWRHFVQGAQRSRRSLRDAINATSDGPLKARLGEIAERLEQALEESWAIAKRGDEIDAAVTRIDPVRLRSRLDTLTKASATGEGDTPESDTPEGDTPEGDTPEGDTPEGDTPEGDASEGDLGAAIASLESQLASAERLKALSASTADRLRLTQARLDELVARAAEVSVGTSDTDSYEHDVDSLVVELEGLRLAVAEINEVS